MKSSALGRGAHVSSPCKSLLTSVSVCCKLYNIDALQATHLLYASSRASTARFKHVIHSTLRTTHLIYASSYAYPVLVGSHVVTPLPSCVCHGATQLQKVPRASRSDERSIEPDCFSLCIYNPPHCSTRRSCTTLLLVCEHCW